MSYVTSLKIHLNDWNTVRCNETHFSCSDYGDKEYFFILLITWFFNVLVTWVSRSCSTATKKWVVTVFWVFFVWFCCFIYMSSLLLVLQLWTILQPKLHSPDTVRVLADTFWVKILPKSFLTSHCKTSSSTFLFFRSSNNQWYSQSIQCIRYRFFFTYCQLPFS